MQIATDLIPKDKADIPTALKLYGRPFEEVKSIIPELFDWLQDMNWPVAGAVCCLKIFQKAAVIPEKLQL